MITIVSGDQPLQHFGDVESALYFLQNHSDAETVICFPAELGEGPMRRIHNHLDSQNEFTNTFVYKTADPAAERIVSLLEDDATSIDIDIAFDLMEEIAYSTARLKGFHDEARDFSTVIALIHSELSEALEAARSLSQSEKIPSFSGVEEELADVLIRTFDASREFGLNLAGAAIEKMRHNLTRPHMHGKSF